MSSQSCRILTPADSGGPSSPPPALPEGWLAQWEGVSRKWYYVQRATGTSQWELPTEPSIPTPSSTPHSMASPGPFTPPRRGAMSTPDSEATREIRDLSGKWKAGGSFPATPVDNSQTPAQGLPHTNQSVSSSGMRNTATGAQNQPLHSSNQGMMGQVASDLAGRTASSGSTPKNNQQAAFNAAAGPGLSLQQQQLMAQQQGYPADQHQPNVQYQTPNANEMAQMPPDTQFYPPNTSFPQRPQHANQQQLAGMPANAEAPYPYHTAHSGVPAQQQYQGPANGYAAQGQNNEPLLVQPIQPGQFPPRISPNAQGHSPITVIHPDPNAPPLFPQPHRGAPRGHRGQNYAQHSQSSHNQPQHFTSHVPMQYSEQEQMYQNQPPQQQPQQPQQGFPQDPNMYGRDAGNYRSGYPPYGQQSHGMQRQASQGQPRYPQHQQYGGGYR